MLISPASKLSGVIEKLSCVSSAESDFLPEIIKEAFVLAPAVPYAIQVFVAAFSSASTIPPLITPEDLVEYKIKPVPAYPTSGDVLTILPPALTYPEVSSPPESPIVINFSPVPLVETPFNNTVILLIPEGSPVNVTDVPEVVATGVARVKPPTVPQLAELPSVVRNLPD